MSAVTIIPAPYDPCYCKSGEKYKFCHYPMDQASGMDRFKISQAMYLQKWKSNAENFRNQKCYAWMASRIEGFQPKRILDIGCGDGSGIIALAMAFTSASILSLDDNRDCLEQAKKQCASLGLHSELINRLSFSAKEKKHTLSLTPERLSFTNRITLIEGDLLWDEELLGFLHSQAKFNAITVWLLGTYDIKMECSNIAPIKAFTEVGKYRWLVHQGIYQLADKILKPGGIVHIIDRGVSTDPERLKALSMAEHTDLSIGTSLTLERYDTFNYSEASNKTRITMEKRFTTDLEVHQQESLALTSIVAVKH